MHLNEIVIKAHDNAKEKGFWKEYNLLSYMETKEVYEIEDSIRNAYISQNLMLIVSELSEALESLRENDTDNFKEELADVIIRTCDLAGGLNIDLEAEVIKKMDKNSKRLYKHGKKF